MASSRRRLRKTTTRGSCGSHGAQPYAQLFPALQKVVSTQPAMTVSDPFRVRIGADDVIVIAQPMPQGTIPDYEKVKNEMMQRALLEGLERGRKQWLEELRRNVYVDVRL